MAEEALSGFAGALIGGALTGLVSIWIQYRNQKFDADQRQKQWDRERENEQRAVLRELQLVLPRYISVSRLIYGMQRDRYLAERYPNREEYQARELTAEERQEAGQFNGLREQVRALISQVKDGKVRRAADIVGLISSDMALSWPGTWIETEGLYGGQDPTILVVDRQRQLNRIIGKVLRGDSIDDEIVEDPVPQPEVDDGVEER